MMYKFDVEFKKNIKKKAPYIKIAAEPSIEELEEEYSESFFDQALTETFMNEYISKFDFELDSEHIETEVEINGQINKLKNELSKVFVPGVIRYNFFRELYSPKLLELNETNFILINYPVKEITELLTDEYKQSIDISTIFSKSEDNYEEYLRINSIITSKLRQIQNNHSKLLSNVKETIINLHNIAAEKFDEETEKMYINIKL